MLNLTSLIEIINFILNKFNCQNLNQFLKKNWNWMYPCRYKIPSQNAIMRSLEDLSTTVFIHHDAWTTFLTLHPAFQQVCIILNSTLACTVLETMQHVQLKKKRLYVTSMNISEQFKATHPMEFSTLTDDAVILTDRKHLHPLNVLLWTGIDWKSWHRDKIKWYMIS